MENLTYQELKLKFEKAKENSNDLLGKETEIKKLTDETIELSNKLSEMEKENRTCQIKGIEIVYTLDEVEKSKIVVEENTKILSDYRNDLKKSLELVDSLVLDLQNHPEFKKKINDSLIKKEQEKMSEAEKKDEGLKNYNVALNVFEKNPETINIIKNRLVLQCQIEDIKESVEAEKTLFESEFGTQYNQPEEIKQQIVEIEDNIKKYNEDLGKNVLKYINENNLTNNLEEVMLFLVDFNFEKEMDSNFKTYKKSFDQINKLKGKNVEEKVKPIYTVEPKIEKTVEEKVESKEAVITPIIKEDEVKDETDKFSTQKIHSLDKWVEKFNTTNPEKIDEIKKLEKEIEEMGQMPEEVVEALSIYDGEYLKNTENNIEKINECMEKLTPEEIEIFNKVIQLEELKGGKLLNEKVENDIDLSKLEEEDVKQSDLKNILKKLKNKIMSSILTFEESDIIEANNKEKDLLSKIKEFDNKVLKEEDKKSKSESASEKDIMDRRIEELNKKRSELTQVYMELKYEEPKEVLALTTINEEPRMQKALNFIKNGMKKVFLSSEENQLIANKKEDSLEKRVKVTYADLIKLDSSIRKQESKAEIDRNTGKISKKQNEEIIEKVELEKQRLSILTKEYQVLMGVYRQNSEQENEKNPRRELTVEEQIKVEEVRLFSIKSELLMGEKSGKLTSAKRVKLEDEINTHTSKIEALQNQESFKGSLEVKDKEKLVKEAIEKSKNGENKETEKEEKTK